MKKYFPLFISLFIFLTLSSITYSADYGFFAGGAFTGLRMDGSGEYTVNYEEITYLYPVNGNQSYSFVTPFDVTDGHILSWNNHLLFGFKGELGYRFNDRISTLFSFDYFFTKKGSAPNLVTIKDNSAFELDRSASALADDDVYSYYDRKTLRLLGQFYFTRSFFILSGIEYIIMDAEILRYYYDEESGYDKTSDNCTGLIVGLGIERPVSDKFSLIGTTLYSFSEYNGDQFYYGSYIDDFSFEVGGLEMSLGLRWYLR